MSWIGFLSRTILLVSAAVALGWLFGYPLEAAIVALLVVFALWVREIRILEQWLESPQGEPPVVVGCGNISQLISADRRKMSAHSQELLLQRDHLLAAFDSVPDSIVIADSHEALIWCNSATSRLLALDGEDNRGRKISEFLPYQDISSYLQAGDFSDPLQFNNGAGLDLHLSASRSGEGDYLLVVRDVTRRVKQEQVRRDFVGNVSHELRTPLTVISGYLETFLTLGESMPRNMVRPVEQMAQQAERMENLLQDLLWLSRIESDEREEKWESIDVASLLAELRDEIAIAHPNRRLITRISINEKVLGDYRELYSAVSNLVQNAIKYSEPETPVTVSWRVGIGGYHLSVSDLGMGIEKKHIRRLTERFYRVDDSRSSATGGTGLGLAIVKHVAVSHEARLQIESEVGRGSMFTLIFPAQQGGSL